MSVHHDIQTIFVEIIKNGSNSIERALARDENILCNHDRYELLVDEHIFNGYNLSGYYSFAIQRNPYDRFAEISEVMNVLYRGTFDFDSLLTYIQERWDRTTGQSISQYDSAGNFIEHPLKGNLRNWWDDCFLILKPQASFVLDGSNNLLVTETLPFEDLQGSWDIARGKIFNLSNITLQEDLPEVFHNSERVDWRTYYEGEIGQQRKEKIDLFYDIDFQTFGYSKTIN
jgi:hypothetical protein